MSEPTLREPSWDHSPAAAAAPTWPVPDHPQRLIHEALWHWHLGRAATPSTFLPSVDGIIASGDSDKENISVLAEGLRSDDELEAVNSAYCLAKQGGVEAVEALIAALPEATPAQKDWSGNGNGAAHSCDF
jgi:hypothetical protein